VKPRVGETWATDAPHWETVIIKRDYGDGSFSCQGKRFRAQGLFRFGKDYGASYALTTRVPTPKPRRARKGRKS
jgi:hypothetical protein